MLNNNPQTTILNTSEPTYRKKLNKEQIAVLRILYQFRFASSEQIARHQQKKSTKSIQKRLKILEDQDLIAKRYDKSYKLQGKPAAYYLTPKGARALRSSTPQKPDEPMNIKRIYKDKDVSDDFIEHCKNICNVYLALNSLYPTNKTLGFFTKSEVSYEKYDCFPSPPQDAFIRLKTSQGEKFFLLDIFEDNQPFFVLIRRIKKYFDYAGSGGWDERTGVILPTILLVVEGKSVHKRLRKRLLKELGESYEDITFATTRLEYIVNPDLKGKVWFPADEEWDDPDDPRKPVALNKLGE